MKRLIKKRSAQGLLLIAVAVLLVGCLGYPLSERRYDVTSNPAWWGQMHLNQVLELNHDVLLNMGELTDSAYKDTPYFTSHQNVTVEMFKANPGKYWADIHFIPKGTRLHCVKLERYWTSEYSDYRLSAEILDGEFKGTVVEVPCAGGNVFKKGSVYLITHMVNSVEQ